MKKRKKFLVIIIFILIALGIILFISLAITGNIRMGGGHPFGWLYF